MIKIIIPFLFCLVVLLGCNNSYKNQAEIYLLHIPNDSLKDEKALQNGLLKNKITEIEVLNFSQKYTKDTLRVYSILNAFCNNLENITIEEDEKYFASILYKINSFIELVKSIKNQKHKKFLDIGCGNGEKLFLAKYLGFEEVKGIEYSDTVFKIASKNWKNLLQPKKFEILKKDAFQAENEIKDADFIYMYSPIKDLKLMSNLYHKCVQNMKNGSVLLEVRMVYSEEVRKKIFKNMPEIVGFFVIKKEKNQYFYLKPLDMYEKKWDLLHKI